MMGERAVAHPLTHSPTHPLTHSPPDGPAPGNRRVGTITPGRRRPVVAGPRFLAAAGSLGAAGPGGRLLHLPEPDLRHRLLVAGEDGGDHRPHRLDPDPGPV